MTPCQPSIFACPLGLDRCAAVLEERVRELKLSEERNLVTYSDLAKKIDKLQYWIMGTLAAALGAIVAALLRR